MSHIRGKNTSIEVAFRKAIYATGTRGYRIRGRVPGSPDIYFSRLRLAVFIDGCFWHRCPTCFRKPKSNLKYWNKKIRDNVARDRRTNVALQKEGIRFIRIWEHDVRSRLPQAMKRFAAVHAAAMGRLARIG